MNMNEIGQRAKAASRMMARATREAKVAVLLSLANHLLDASDAILEANQIGYSRRHEKFPSGNVERNHMVRAKTDNNL